MKDDMGSSRTNIGLSTETAPGSDLNAAREWNEFQDRGRETRQAFQRYYMLAMNNALTETQKAEFRALLQDIKAKGIGNIFLNTEPVESMIKKYPPKKHYLPIGFGFCSENTR